MKKSNKFAFTIASIMTTATLAFIVIILSEKVADILKIIQDGDTITVLGFSVILVFSSAFAASLFACFKKAGRIKKG